MPLWRVNVKLLDSIRVGDGKTSKNERQLLRSARETARLSISQDVKKGEQQMQT
jgi:hypothetical protein